MTNFPSALLEMLSPNNYNLLIETIRHNEWGSTNMKLNDGTPVAAIGFTTYHEDEETWKGIFNILNGIGKLDIDYEPDAWCQFPMNGSLYIPATDAEQWKVWASAAPFKPTPLTDGDITLFNDQVGCACSKVVDILLKESNAIARQVSSSHYQPESFQDGMRKAAITAILNMAKNVALS